MYIWNDSVILNFFQSFFFFNFMFTFVIFFEVYRKHAYSMYPGKKCKQVETYFLSGKINEFKKNKKTLKPAPFPIQSHTKQDQPGQACYIPVMSKYHFWTHLVLVTWKVRALKNIVT